MIFVPGRQTLATPLVLWYLLCPRFVIFVRLPICQWFNLKVSVDIVFVKNLVHVCESIVYMTHGDREKLFNGNIIRPTSEISLEFII